MLRHAKRLRYHLTALAERCDNAHYKNTPWAVRNVERLWRWACAQERPREFQWILRVHLPWMFRTEITDSQDQSSIGTCCYAVYERGTWQWKAHPQQAKQAS